MALPQNQKKSWVIFQPLRSGCNHTSYQGPSFEATPALLGVSKSKAMSHQTPPWNCKNPITLICTTIFEGLHLFRALTNPSTLYFAIESKLWMMFSTLFNSIVEFNSFWITLHSWWDSLQKCLSWQLDLSPGFLLWSIPFRHLVWIRSCTFVNIILSWMDIPKISLFPSYSSPLDRHGWLQACNWRTKWRISCIYRLL
jgi:hypothetical protein